jgi:hypothetical protein
MSTLNRPVREIVDVASLEWQGRAGTPVQLKVLKVNDDFSYIQITKGTEGDVGPAHVHVGPSEVFFLEGKVQTAAGVAEKGCWVLEPAGAMHRATKTLESGTALTHVRGPMLLLDQDGVAPNAIYGQSLKAAMTLGASIVDKTLPELTAAMYPEDYDSGVVVLESLEWVPSGYEGIQYRVVYVADNGEFVLFVRAEDGATLPPRRYCAPADFYVLSGCLRFKDGEATPDHWVYEPLGAEEDAVSHVGETTYLATFEGAVLDIGSDGSARRVLDAHAVRDIPAAALTH